MFVVVVVITGTCNDGTTCSVPVKDLVKFMLDCRVLHPSSTHLRPCFFMPASLPGQSKDGDVKFILNHSDHVQVVRCLTGKGGKVVFKCLTMV